MYAYHHTKVFTMQRCSFVVIYYSYANFFILSRLQRSAPSIDTSLSQLFEDIGLGMSIRGETFRIVGTITPNRTLQVR